MESPISITIYPMDNMSTSLFHSSRRMQTVQAVRMYQIVAVEVLVVVIAVVIAVITVVITCATAVQGLRDREGRRDFQVFRGRRVRRAVLGREGLRARQVHRGLVGQQGRRVHRDQEAFRV